MQLPGAHIVHDHQPPDIVIRFFGGNISALPGDNDGYLQLEIQFLEMVRPTADIAGPLYTMRIGKIKDGVLIELRDHGHPPVAPRRGNMLTEGVSIPAGSGDGHGSQYRNVLKRDGLTGANMPLPDA